MPTLEWIGKDKVVNHHQEVPFICRRRNNLWGTIIKKFKNPKRFFH